MKVVISIGGSLLTKELTPENFRKYADVILQLWKKGHKLIVVCGGGKVCREYRDVGKDLGADYDQLDFIGIMATHLNASTLLPALGKLGYLVAWKSLKEAIKEVKKNFGKKILVAGGYDVGTSSDYDAAIFAYSVKADLLINATNVDGVYSDDPKKNPNAKKYDKLTFDQFENIISKNPQSPGEYRLFDLAATKLIKKAKIKTIFIDGNDSQEILRAVEGKHNGTVIES
jgi:uridylate kinase